MITLDYYALISYINHARKAIFSLSVLLLPAVSFLLPVKYGCCGIYVDGFNGQHHQQKRELTFVDTTSKITRHSLDCCAYRWVSGHSYRQHYNNCKAAPATALEYIFDHPFGHFRSLGRSSYGANNNCYIE